MTETIHFPEGFQWGAATSSYQIEGGVDEDGRGPTIWDEFAHTPDKTLNGETGDVASDHYHLWKEDVKMMKALGIKAYRFSLAWSRILPDGRGKVNPAGLNYYDRLIDRLLNAGITPMVTLYHWDLPSRLPGGWLARSTVDAFVEYTNAAARAFGDRVKYWVTINEPWCASILSYALGLHAPGQRDLGQALAAAHHLLLAHGLAVTELKKLSRKCQVGTALSLTPVIPLTNSQADQAAARHHDGAGNRWFLDPLYGRGYPADVVADYVRMGALPASQPEYIQPGDMEKIAAPTDFLGVNYYTRHVVSAGPEIETNPADVRHKPVPADQVTDMGWEVYPQGLYDLLMRLYREYHPAALIITEGGASYGDGPGEDGKVHDDRRIEYLKSHIAAAGRAIQDGAPLKGYYAWSLMDNFEWAYGYSQRFGLVHVDFADQKRTPKDSALWYREVASANRITVE